VIADDPEKRRLRVRIDGVHRAVDDQIERHPRPPIGGILACLDAAVVPAGLLA
jgi:hypothetical protein